MKSLNVRKHAFSLATIDDLLSLGCSWHHQEWVDDLAGGWRLSVHDCNGKFVKVVMNFVVHEIYDDQNSSTRESKSTNKSKTVPSKVRKIGTLYVSIMYS